LSIATRDGIFEYVFMWHALSDACPVCRGLNGREWRDQDIFQDVLWDPFYGDIWDLNRDIPLTHPNCRCQLEVRVIIHWDNINGLAEFKKALQGLR